MSAPNFNFPPPPPPPPKAAPSSYSAYSQSSFVQSNGSGGRAGRPSRGKGRGEGYRGPRGVMFRGQGNPSSFGAGPPRDGGYRPHQNTAYSQHVHTDASTSYPLPEYPREQHPQYHPLQNGFPPYPPQGNYSQQGPYEVAQPHMNQLYNSGLSTQPYAHGYGPLSYGAPQIQVPFQTPPNQPSIMAPPIRMGFESVHSQGFHPEPYGAQSHGQPEDGRRMGRNPRYYEHSPPGGQRNPNHQKQNRNPSSNHVNNNLLQTPKRGTAIALHRPANSSTRPQAAPAVPSFGIPLPLKPPAPNDHGKTSRKKKRKHNLLGLTPKADVHESSEEEEDADEEANLAAAAGAGGREEKCLQFTYRGQTATLQSPADIAAWIAERKKRFPTRERIQEAAERKRVLQEAQKAAKESFKQTQDNRKNELRGRRRQDKPEEDKKERLRLDPKDVAVKAKLKAEKLRKRLDKEEKKIAKAEAKAEKARVKTEAATKGASFPQSVVAGTKRKRGASDGGAEGLSHNSEEPAVGVKHDLSNGKGDGEPDTETTAVTEQSVIDGDGHVMSLEEMITAASTNVYDPQRMESHPFVAEPNSVPEPTKTSRIAFNTSLKEELSPLEDMVESDSESDDTMSISSSSPEPSSDDDDTSSSGSSSDEGGPDEAPSKRAGPERVPPPKREKPKSRCTQFLKTGFCKRGNRCKFLHELPERGSSRGGPAAAKKAIMKGRDGPKPKRKSLYERLVEQEKEKEDEQVLRAIIQLGQSGVLDPPSTVAELIATPAEKGS